MRDDGVIGKIEKQEWLKPPEEGLQNLIRKAFRFRGGRQVKNFLHGTWVGTLYTQFLPIYRLAHGQRQSPSTRWIPWAHVVNTVPRRIQRWRSGSFGAVGAAASGLTDWQDIDPPARRATIPDFRIRAFCWCNALSLHCVCTVFGHRTSVPIRFTGLPRVGVWQAIRGEGVVGSHAGTSRGFWRCAGVYRVAGVARLQEI
jgi:hypothetical protein